MHKLELSLPPKFHLPDNGKMFKFHAWPCFGDETPERLEAHLARLQMVTNYKGRFPMGWQRKTSKMARKSVL